MTASDPFRPSVPRRDEPGRLSLHSPLQPGWPCRWCLRGLSVVIKFGTLAPSDFAACANCDNPRGATP